MTYLFLVDFHNSLVAHRLGNFARPSLECASLFASLDRYDELAFSVSSSRSFSCGLFLFLSLLLGRFRSLCFGCLLFGGVLGFGSASAAPSICF